MTRHTDAEAPTFHSEYTGHNRWQEFILSFVLEAPDQDSRPSQQFQNFPGDDNTGHIFLKGEGA